MQMSYIIYLLKQGKIYMKRAKSLSCKLTYTSSKFKLEGKKTEFNRHLMLRMQVISASKALHRCRIS